MKRHLRATFEADDAEGLYQAMEALADELKYADIVPSKTEGFLRRRIGSRGGAWVTCRFEWDTEGEEKDPCTPT